MEKSEKKIRWIGTVRELIYKSKRGKRSRRLYLNIPKAFHGYFTPGEELEVTILLNNNGDDE